MVQHGVLVVGQEALVVLNNHMVNVKNKCKPLLKHSGFQWTKPNVTPYTGTPGIKVPLSNNPTTGDFLIYFLPINFLTSLLHEQICMQLNTRGTIPILHHIAVPMSGLPQPELK